MAGTKRTGDFKLYKPEERWGTPKLILTRHKPEEPWRTAQLILTHRGANAESYLSRLIADYIKRDDIDGVAKLLEVQQAIKSLRCRPASTRCPANSLDRSDDIGAGP